MHDHSNHAELLAGFKAQLGPVLESSEQAMYVFFDDEHKFCNERFAKALGYASADAWAAAEGQFTALYVDEKSQRTLVGAYMDAMDKAVGSTNAITWKKQGGGTVESTTILVPMAFEDHLFAVHFITL